MLFLSFVQLKVFLCTSVKILIGFCVLKMYNISEVEAKTEKKKDTERKSEVIKSIFMIKLTYKREKKVKLFLLVHRSEN